MPIRLGLTALVVVLSVVLALRIIGQVRKAEKARNSEMQRIRSSKNNIQGLDLDHFNTPEIFEPNVTRQLNEIVKLSELMIATAPSSEIRQNGRKILNATRNAQNILDNQSLLATKIDMPNYKPVNVNFHNLAKTIVDLWAPQFSGSKVKFTCHLDPNVPELLFIDQGVINRILHSLLSNSQVMTQQGRIHFHITATNPSDYDWTVNLIVADTGRGFPNTFKSSLRDDPSSIKPANNEEFNLLAVKQLLPIIKGRLQINSVEQKGTEISISFPARAGQTVTQQSEINAAKSKLEKDGPLSGKRILVIEDDISSQEVLQTFLVPEGCKVHCIPDGEQALITLETNDFDLVLMDVRMDGLDGIKTTHAIRNSGRPYKHIPIIAITADVDPDTNAKCMMAGADLFLNKPIGSKALFDGIRFVMDLGVENRPEQVSISA